MVRTAVGYSGGQSVNPDYRNIGDHSEVIQVEYDPQRVSYEELLQVFWESHDPNYDSYLRQYRNAIFYLDNKQKRAAEQSRQLVKQEVSGPVYTAIEAAGTFTLAEDYHQKYLLRKAEGLLQEVQAIYPEESDFVSSTAAARINGYLGCYGDADTMQQEIAGLGLSRSMQELLVMHVNTSCDGFASVTCPAPKK